MKIKPNQRSMTGKAPAGPTKPNSSRPSLAKPANQGGKPVRVVKRVVYG